MQYSVFINQPKAIEWGLNPQQAILFSFLYSVPSWANEEKRGDKVFYSISKAKIVKELPLLTSKPDTAYRLLKALESKGLIELSSTPKITLVRLTNKAKGWNVYPEKDIGKISEEGRKNLRQPSEKSPTNPNSIDPNSSNPISNSSSKPDNDVAKQVIDYLNLKTGRKYQHTKTNIGLVNARIKEGITVEQLRQVIDQKCKEWAGSKFEQYLRPATLFGAEKCNQYVGQIGMSVNSSGSGFGGGWDQFDFRGQTV